MKKILAHFTQNLAPSSYLFPGRAPASHLSARAASLLLNRACKKAGLAGSKNMLKLRHSFVAHLLECGLDKDCVQKLLAHYRVWKLQPGVSNGGRNSVKRRKPS